MRDIVLSVQEHDGRAVATAVGVGQVLLAGYAGRNREKVLEHIAELEAVGIAAPERVPSFYVVEPELLSTEPGITVGGTQTSGEAEFFLLFTELGVLVGVGSDHTDRAHEAISIPESKAMCAKPISLLVWRYDQVSDHWDELELRSWVTDGRGHRLYQEGRLDALLSVDDLLEEVMAAGYPHRNGLLLFGGTVPTIGGLAYGHHFEVELYDPVLDRRLFRAYDVTRS